MVSPYFKNAIISVGLLVIVNTVMNKITGRQPFIDCSDGVNDFKWNTTYASPKWFNPNSVKRQSTYVTMSDGVQLAVDYYLSSHFEKYDLKLPTVLHITRHGRGYTVDRPFSFFTQEGNMTNPRMSSILKRFITHGYAWVSVEVRGSGASFGTKEYDFSERETKDSVEIVDWIISQPWSDGSVGSYGLGYEGGATFALASKGHPGLKAIALNGVSIDLYSNMLFPGGLPNKRARDQYSTFTSATDQNERWDSIPGFAARVIMYHFGGNMLPINGDLKALEAAVSEHKKNPSLQQLLQNVQFRDDLLWNGNSNASFNDMDIKKYLDAVRASGVPTYSFGGYYDAANIRGVIDSFQVLTSENAALPNHRITLGPWNHAGVDNCDPFAASYQKCFDHLEHVIRFFDYHMYSERREATGLDLVAPIHYFTMVENKWKESYVWPPLTFETKTLFFSKNNTLELLSEDVSDGIDELGIDYEGSTGIISRWHMVDHLFSKPANYVHDRQSMDQVYLTYQTSALPQMEFTGEAELRLFVSVVDSGDVALIAYLEDVDFTFSGWGGKQRRGVTYITEAVVRPAHRASKENPAARSFLREDWKLLEKDQVHEVIFRFNPVSYFIRQGHKLRVTIAGAQFDDFDLQRDHMAPKINIHYSSDYPSSIKLPIHEIPLPPRKTEKSHEPQKEKHLDTESKDEL